MAHSVKKVYLDSRNLICGRQIDEYTEQENIKKTKEKLHAVERPHLLSLKFFLKGFRFGALKIESADHVFTLADTKAFSHLDYALVPVEVRCKTIMVIKALLVPTKKVLCGKNKY